MTLKGSTPRRPDEQSFSDAGKLILGLGAGGHARVIIDAIRMAGNYEIVGLIDQSESTRGQSVDGVEVLGGEARLEEFLSRGVHYVFNGVGGVANNAWHAAIHERVSALGFEFLTIIHPAAVVASTAIIGAGSVVLARSVINAGAVLGRNTIINTGAIVEHDCVVGEHSHVAPGAVLLGNVTVGKRCLIGANAVVRQGLTVGDLATVGAGAVVASDVSSGMSVIGVPAKPLYAYSIL